MILKKDKRFSLPLSKEELLLIAHHFSEEAGTLLLLSGGSFDSARQSILALFPIKRVLLNHLKVRVIEGNGREIFEIEDPWKALEEYFFSSFHRDQKEMAIGWFGYGLAAYAIEQPSLYKSSPFPDAYWQLSALLLIFDEETFEAEILVDDSAFGRLPEEQERMVRFLSEPEGWSHLLQELKQKKAHEKEERKLSRLVSQGLKESYLQKVEEIQELIREGEVYQVNLAQHFIFTSEKSSFELFKETFFRNPSPFSAFMRIEEGALLSISPERFLSKKEGKLETRPIKGTAPRGKSPSEDQRNLDQLLASEKECAELLMITDLMRNDLGKISQPGSVSIIDLRRWEAYTNVFHLLSVIESVPKELSSLEIVRSCFPAGSITGCPKERAIELIHAFENEARGVYTGSIGYFKGNGDFDLNVAIRTALFDGSVYDLPLGSGIVIDSEAEKEYQEMLYKGASFFEKSEKMV